MKSTVPVVSLSAKKLAANIDIMVAGNKLLNAMAAKAGKSRKAFRAKLFGGSKIPAKIQAVRNIECEMLSGFSRLCMKIASRYSYHLFSEEIAKDMLQEAHMALSEAIFGYLGDVKFITYAANIIVHRMMTFLRYETNFSALPEKVIKLRTKVSILQRRLDCSEEEALTQLELDHEQTQLYRDYAVTSKVASTFDETEYNDYTVYRRGIDREGNKTVDCDLMDACNNASLNVNERLVVNTWLNDGTWGWQIRLAKEMVNSITGKPMTRAGVRFILKSALAKIKNVYTSKSYSEVA